MNHDGCTPLCEAVIANNLEQVKWLLAQGADVKEAYIDWTPLHWAASQAKDPLITKELLAAGADIESRDPEVNPPLSLACWKGRIKTVKALIKADADVNAIGESGWRPIHWALCDDAGGHIPKGNFGQMVQVLKALIKAGADVNAKTNDGETAYDLAGENGFLKTFPAKLEEIQGILSDSMTMATAN